MKINILASLLILSFFGCNSNNDHKVEKFQKKRNNIVNVDDKIIDVEIEQVFGNSLLYIIDDFLVVDEISPSGEKGIHLFDKHTFKYITSTGIIGKGPGEVTRQGRLGIDNKNNIIWVSDHGKKLLWKFPLDSILSNNRYMPTESIALLNSIFIERFDFLNDSIALGKAVRVLSNSSFDMAMAKLNLNTNETTVFGYEHPEAVGKKSNSYFALSLENNYYVNCYVYCDLITICDLNGKLKYNIYGRSWLNKDNKKSYFNGVDIINDHIVAAYNGDAGIVLDQNKRPKGKLPSKFLVFDMNGDYIETIETGYDFTYFCVDEENQRIIAYFDGRENPLGYFNLNIN